MKRTCFVYGVGGGVLVACALSFLLASCGGGGGGAPMTTIPLFQVLWQFPVQHSTEQQP